MERCGLGAGVGDADLHEQVMRIGLGVDDVDHPVAVLVERSGVQQLVLGLALVPPAVLGDQVGVGELGLRVVVPPPQPRVAGEGVEVPPVLLDVLPVVALGAGQAEHPLLDDRVPAVPQGERHAQVLGDVADTRHAVLAPAVRAGSGVVVREVVPGRPARAVVLADSAPRPLREVRAPVVPRCGVMEAVLGVAERGHSLAFHPGHVGAPVVGGATADAGSLASPALPGIMRQG